MTDTELYALAIRAAYEAGEIVLKIYEQDIAVEYKEDDSPLTFADKRSHAVIKERLLSTKLPILSEEGRDIPFEERREWERFWLVDPLDGTKEFVKRNGEFTVNIALIEQGRPVFGVVVVPVKDVIYVGISGQEAWKAKGERAVLKESFQEFIANAKPLPLPRDASRPFTVVGSRSHPSEALQGYLDTLKGKHGDLEMVPAGSSLKFCLVAEGRADTYPRLGPTMEWDTGAGQAVVEGAGGSVMEYESGRPLGYNKENLLNPWFVVA